MADLNRSQFFKEWYLKKGFIIIDIFIIFALIQYFVFNGSFLELKEWFIGLFQFLF